MDQLSTVLAARGPALASVLFILSAIFLASKVLGGSPVSNTPLVGEDLGGPNKRRTAYLERARELYKKGYETFRGKPFRLTTLDGDEYVVPRDLMDELRRLPDDHVNIDKAFLKINEATYTKFGGNPHQTKFLLHVIRSDLTHNLTRINPRLSAEAARTVADELGPCEDWTPHVVYTKLLRVVAIISGTIFLGPDLCRREEYLHASINFTVALFTAISKLKRWPSWTRWIGQYFVPELRLVFEHRKKARQFLAPVIKERRRMMAAGEDLPDDMLQWMLNKSDEFKVSDATMADLQLSLSLAAIHTTTFTTTLALYDIVVRPGLVKELREEIRAVTAANGGVMSTHALFEMKYLDSVMKESQRTNPGSLVRFTRYVDKPLTLSDGTQIPAGTMLQAPHGSIVADPTLYTKPEAFNPRRFMDLRNSAVPDPMNYRNKEQYQFVTVTKDFMAFGYGRHACPGRFFAANEIKLMLANILNQYDIKMPDGETERYPNLDMGMDSLPDPTRTIMFKKAAA